MRKTRFIENCRCYHLISRLEHQAFFLDDNEKTRAVELLRRVEKRGEGPHCIRTDRWKMMAAVVLLALAAGRRNGGLGITRMDLFVGAWTA